MKAFYLLFSLLSLYNALSINETDACITAIGAKENQMVGIPLSFAGKCNALTELLPLETIIPGNAPFDKAEKRQNVIAAWNKVFRLLCAKNTTQDCLNVFNDNVADVKDKCTTATTTNYTASATVFSVIAKDPYCYMPKDSQYLCGSTFSEAYSSFSVLTSNFNSTGNVTAIKDIICTSCVSNVLTSPYGYVPVIPLPNLDKMAASYSQYCNASFIASNTYNDGVVVDGIKIDITPIDPGTNTTTTTSDAKKITSMIGITGLISLMLLIAL